MTTPNLISLARLFVAPIVVWLMLKGEALAFWLFVVASASDAVDGYLAKRFYRVTELGRYLDPLADKALLVGVYVTLGYLGLLPPWIVILVVFRDILIIGGSLLLWLLVRSLKVRPLMISKVNTVAQFVLAAIVLAAAAHGLSLAGVIAALTYVVAATTLWSGAAYLVQGLRAAAHLEAEG